MKTQTTFLLCLKLIYNQNDSITTMKHEAIGLNNELPKGRISGYLTLSDRQITFSFDEKQVSMELNRSTITQGGTGNRYAYFKSSGLPEWTFYSDDLSILKRKEIINNDSLNNAASKIKNNRNLFKLSAITLVVVFILALGSIFLFRGPIINSIVHKIPPTWEREMSTSMSSTLLTGQTIITDKSINQRLKRITDPLINGLDDSDFEFSFTIIEDETLNAFALPGGDIVIHSGLIMKANDVTEVAGVLAHEISHVTGRHHLRGIVDKLGIFMLIQALLGDASPLIAEIAYTGSALESLRYSRKFENEADENGWNLMLASNLNPNGMIDFFKKLDHEHGHEHESIEELSTFISTHPNTKSRIKNLEQKTNEQTNYTVININFQQFQADIEQYINN